MSSFIDLEIVSVTLDSYINNLLSRITQFDYYVKENKYILIMTESLIANIMRIVCVCVCARIYMHQLQHYKCRQYECK